MTDKNGGARRAQGRKPVPKWTIAFCAFMVAILVGLVVLVVRTPLQSTAAPAPQPTATWTTYVPQMPVECYELVSASARLAIIVEEDLKLTRKIAPLIEQQKFAEVTKVNAEAGKLSKELDHRQAEVIKWAKKCQAK